MTDEEKNNPIENEEEFNPSHIFDPILKLELQLEKDIYHNDFVPWEQHMRGVKAKYRQSAQKYYDRLVRGSQIITEYFELHLLKKQENNSSELQKTDDENTVESNTEVENTEDGQDNQQDDNEVTDEMIAKVGIEAIYNCGCNLYEELKFADAADIFFFITHVAPLRHNAWVMLGMSEQMNNNHEVAAGCYFQSTLLNRDSPHPFLYLAQCFHHLGDKETVTYYIDIISQNKEWEENFPDVYQCALELAELSAQS